LSELAEASAVTMNLHRVDDTPSSLPASSRC
jgi:hypothetical protein